MVSNRPPIRFRTTRHQRLKLLDQLLPQRIIMRQLGKRQRAIPRTHLGVVDRLGV